MFDEGPRENERVSTKVRRSGGGDEGEMPLDTGGSTGLTQGIHPKRARFTGHKYHWRPFAFNKERLLGGKRLRGVNCCGIDGQRR